MALVLVALACARSGEPVDYRNITPLPGGAPFSFSEGEVPLGPGNAGVPFATVPPPTPVVAGLPTPTPRPTLDIASSPTPDPLRPSALDRTTTEQYTVQRGDTLNEIGVRYGVTAGQIAQANGMQVTDVLHVGQVLLVPLPDRSSLGSALKIVPDSALVYGPADIDFNLDGYVQAQGGYLARYTEEIDAAYLDGVQARTLTGSQIVHLVATRYSVSPRMLLAVLEYQSGWVTNPRPDDATLAFPLGRVEAGREGLYRQLSWAANQLNLGYYGWRAGWLVSFILNDGNLRLIAPGLNAGTVGVQNFFSKALTANGWARAVSAEGFMRTYHRLFGSPFRVAVEPLIPPDLKQPELILPFEPDKVWAFTGGPHGAWDTGSAWGALDFAPPAKARGCVPSNEWVVASAPGLVVRSEYGAVIVDLDGDGFEGSGWALFYMHLEARERVAVGTFVNTGDRLGHPSCEGGFSDGTHVHFARKYNGEWINADGPIPFVLDGWVPQETPREYDGFLLKDGVSLEACACREEGNEISR